MSSADVNFRYLNHEGVWNGFAQDGLELRTDGSLALAGLPAPSSVRATPTSETSAAPAVPTHSAAGIAIDVAGNVYYSFPEQHRIDRVDACMGEPTRLPCLSGPGADPGELRTPRGLLAIDARGALLICDSGNHRLQLVDPLSGQILEIWSGPLVTPVAAALDHTDHTYIADEGARTVFKLAPDGSWIESFAQDVTESDLLERPVAVAVVRQLEAQAAPSLWVYVLDRARHAVFIFDARGNPVSDALGQPLSVTDQYINDPIALTANARSLYVLDRDADGSTRVLRFEVGSGYRFVGEVPGLGGASALLSVAGRLWVQRVGQPPLAWIEQTAFRQQGSLASPAIDPGRKVSWTSLHLDAEPLAPGAHVQLWSRISDDPVAADSAWQAAPRDALQIHLGERSGRYLWIRIHLSGDGVVTPVLRNACVRFDQRGYLDKLPSIYNAQVPSRDFLVRFLALFESMNLELEDRIEQLPRLFDPNAVPDEFLPWLSSWLALELDERWSADKQRAAISRAYRAYADRGTVDGLRRTVQFETGLAVVLVEPILHTSWWALPAGENACGPNAPRDDGSAGTGSLLGFTTMLAAAEPDSAVVDTAILDRSRILHESDYGVPLFDDTAHRFVAHVYRGRADVPAARTALVGVIEREKPAHTSYRLLSIEPRFAVGMQSTVGFDTVVAGPPEPTALGTSSGPLQLAGDPPARIGTQSHVGQGLRL